MPVLQRPKEPHVEDGNPCWCGAVIARTAVGYAVVHNDDLGALLGLLPVWLAGDGYVLRYDPTASFRS